MSRRGEGEFLNCRLSPAAAAAAATMRRLALLALPLLLCLGEVAVAAECGNECGSVNVTVSETEIHIQPPDNHTISNVTFANGTRAGVQTSNTTVSGLQPGTQYEVTFEISAEKLCCKIITTKPSPVFDISLENRSNSTVTLKWSNRDPNASNYTYRILIEGTDPPKKETSNTTNAVIRGLEPGTLYTFTIFPQADNGKIEGEPNHTTVYTRPNPVFGIQVENLSDTGLTLKWNNPNDSNYTYRILIEGTDPPRNKSSDTNSAVIGGLEPGTLYTFRIYSQVDTGTVEGEPDTTTVYTKPSPVFDISLENRSSSTITLKWKNSNPNASNYTYRILIEGTDPPRNETSDTTSAEIGDLKPGTLYTFTIFPQVNNGAVEGEPNATSVYTKPNPVFDISLENRSSSTITLKWKNSDPNASNYTYRILIEGTDPPRNETSDTTSAEIGNLKPGTLYTFTIFPQVNNGAVEGEPNSTSVYTKPSPVFDISLENRSNSTVTLKWSNSDPNASNYTYRILIEGTDPPRSETSDTTSAEIRDLEPGTLYTFTIFPRVDNGAVEGEPNASSVYTKPSPVSGFDVVDIGTVNVTLRWEDNDAASSGYTYIVLYQQNQVEMNATSRKKNITILGLLPGTLYRFSVFPQAADNLTKGDPQTTHRYTAPSSVTNIRVTDVSITTVNLTWENLDAASSAYTYRIQIGGEAIEDKIFPTTSAEISELTPGTDYTFSIYSVAGYNQTEGRPGSINNCTDAARVEVLNCMQVAKQPKLILNWSNPKGRFAGFGVDVLNSTWGSTNILENHTTVTDLNYYTNYTVRIVTHSCGKDSHPQEKICSTSIGDPPSPLIAPTIVGTTHNSLTVQFSSFNASHGPLVAYAVIVTSKDVVSAEALKYTYDDFMNRGADAYVAYVKDEQMRSSSSSNSEQHTIEIGDGSVTHGYVSGKLIPLNSYRVYVAGFTRIDYLNDTIDEKESYVSFSNISNAVVLPQDPDVITGAVVGCILAAAVIAAGIGFFIFWKKRRKGGKNNQVPFTQLESKLFKVEDFESHFKKQKADSNCGFAEEYEELRPVGTNQPRFAAELQENKAKNRYNNVLPYDISRVRLQIHDHPTNDYINANYMPGYNSKKEFIAAQGPLPNTVQDFWRMIWEKKIYTVVMLTKCIEQGRTKCEEYWPNKQSKSYGDITVAMTSEIPLPEWTIRDFSMEKSDSSESHPVRQFHFTAWPDHGVPETTNLLINFRHLVQEYMKQNPPSSPTLVHCSAGVGRTGTFIAIDHLIHQMEMENTVDVYGAVYELRMHRSLMVQTEDQYVFLNQCVLDIIKSQKDKKTDLIYQNTNAMAIYENFTPLPHIGKANGYHA
ncbi:receptor-type tyrosine-protein phosphatase eta isoform X1 [Podarcis lilfordi]|uniref:Receptor-type tyrosine-protein phosphatase eta n=1 Tax=Podarcis lilfordi TaxID=74358 RepID=A0AA35JR87_9SAUR|nr:receptor-type tyrosine-protein phosphatase eta isoform X1 [Podarcis lilfordi]